MDKDRRYGPSVAWSGGRRLGYWRTLLLVGILLTVAPSGIAQGFTLTPASESWAWDDKKVNIIANGYHNVFLERYQGFQSRDYLRIVGVSLDLNGPTTWSLASHGDRHNLAALSGKIEIPQYMPGGPYGAGVAAPGETFYVAITESNELFGPPWGYGYGYGWIQLQLAPPAANPNDPDRSGDLVLLDGFFSYDKRGVIVGEYRVVPEPAALAVAGTAMIGAMCVRRFLARRG